MQKLKCIFFLLVLVFPNIVHAQNRMILTGEASLDGCVKNVGNVFTDLSICIGDDIANNVARGFVSFNIAAIPQGETIVSARIRIYQVAWANSPYDFGESVVVDHLDYGLSLDSDDFDLSAIRSNIGTLSIDQRLEWKSLMVTESVRDDIENERPHSQYRLRFSSQETDNDGKADMTDFESGDNIYGSNNLPQLVITFSPKAMLWIPLLLDD